MSAGSEAKERRAKTGRGAEKARRHSRILEHLFGLHTRSRRVISEHRHRRNNFAIGKYRIAAGGDSIGRIFFSPMFS
jgi:hypothetical protein